MSTQQGGNNTQKKSSPSGLPMFIIIATRVVIVVVGAIAAFLYIRKTNEEAQKKIPQLQAQAQQKIKKTKEQLQALTQQSMQNMTEAQKKATSKSMVEAGFNVAQKGDYDNAIKEFKNAIELDPKNKQAYIDLASAYLGKKF